MKCIFCEIITEVTETKKVAKIEVFNDNLIEKTISCGNGRDIMKLKPSKIIKIKGVIIKSIEKITSIFDTLSNNQSIILQF
ncbi:hypothetical protein [Peptoniphilus indolicus]|uniref:hypothetical protein n=1 Tax=Peptoniphilus indolicus TaxID=33030 RepID=UPI00031886B2|nr:hypothetical protein [Peptoniphilus indolicus]